ncbi:MAG: DpnI domain-containing protein [Rikenellaceae bacterium]
MNLRFDLDIASQYKSNAQIIRVLTESWMAKNMFCPICGEVNLVQYESNRPVADFHCSRCGEQFELKSKHGVMGMRINDGAYSTMIERITSQTNPNFFFLTYTNYCVDNLMLIPNHFFTPEIIERRNPLSPSAKRAGWVGCNINIQTIPNSGKIYIVKQGEQVARDIVIENYSRSKSLLTTNLDSRGWIMDVLSCLDRVQSSSFELRDIYAFEDELRIKHPNNNHIRDKIRQQLQYLRDRGFVEFTNRGCYRKIL